MAHRSAGRRQFMAFSLFVVAMASPVYAQRRVDIFVDVEGVKRSEKVRFEPNVTQYVPRFDTGGGVGRGINVFFGSRVSLEAKVAALESRLHVRRSGSDFVTVADLGYAQIYPITAVLQWHMLDRSAFRPYVGAGVGYIVLRNIEKRGLGVSGATFENPTGLVVDGGLELSLSRRWSVFGDARYTPIETRSHVTFTGTGSTAEIDVKPLIVSTGVAVRF